MRLLKHLRAQSIRRTLAPVLIFWAAAVALFCIFSGPIALRSFSPKTLAELDPEHLEGAFVEDDIPFIYGYVVSTFEKRDGQPEKCTADYYVIDISETDLPCFIVMCANRDTLDAAEDLFDACMDLDYGDPDIPALHIKGSIIPLDEDIWDDYYDLADGDSELEDLMLPYCLNVSRIGTTTIIPTYVLMGVAAALFLWGLILLVKALTGGYQKKVRAKIKEMGESEALLERLDQFYDETEPIGGVRLGDEFVLFANGPSSVLLRPWEVCWAYQSTTQHRTNGINTGKTFCCVLNTLDGRKYELAMKERKVLELLEAISQRLPGTVLGYSKEIEQIYKQQRSFFTERWEKARPGCTSR